MKSKNPKIQLLKKGIATCMSAMLLASPLTYATTSLNDSYLESSLWEKILYGTIGSTANEIEEYLAQDDHTTLYITNETQLRALAEYVNNGNDCTGKQIVLLNDIELDVDQEWVPISVFNGIFNGNNNTISGLRYLKGNKNLTEELNNIGFFKKVDTNGIVKNLTLEDVFIDLPTTELESRSVGAIAGENLGELNNCTVGSGNINGRTGVGGITGRNNGTIISCTNQLLINKNAESGFAIGGIAGYAEANSIITNSINKGSVSGAERVGGVVGNQNNTHVSYCMNEGDIVGRTKSVGGISGYALTAATIQNCINKGAVSGALNYIGGITGENAGTIQNCINEGRISGKAYIGGIAGANVGDLEKCLNDALISGTEYIGGIVGGEYTTLSNDNVGTIKKSENRREISGNKIVGGIIGATNEYARSETSLIEECLNSAIISGVESVGGIVGNSASYGINIGNTKNSGNITADIYVGGIIGSTTSNSTNLVKCKNTGNITADEYASEIIGFVPSFVKLIDEEGEPSANIGFTLDGLSIGAVKNTSSPLGPIVYNLKEEAGTLKISFKKNENDNLCVGDILKVGDKITITAELDKYLVSQNEGALKDIGLTKENAPIVKLNDSLIIQAKDVNHNLTDYKTTIVYEYTIEEGIRIDVKQLSVEKNGKIYVVEKNSNTKYVEIIEPSLKGDIGTLIIDSEKPTVTTEVSVENALETNRYTAGKDIIIKATTSEPIEGDAQRPELEVSFSKSGVGKYNYNGEKAGLAKCIDAKINVDGTTTWTYLYQIQEFDEGELKIKCIEGQLEDLAGNIIDFKENNLEINSDIYADTTAPTVSITPFNVEKGTTNKDILVYVVQFSEKVEGFNEDDVTISNGGYQILINDPTNNGQINMGDIAKIFSTVTGKTEPDLIGKYDIDLDGDIDKDDVNTLFEYVRKIKGEMSGFETENGYFLFIKNTVLPGKTAELKVIIEENVCQDLVGQANVRQENVITIDKIKPTLTSCEAKKEENKIIVEATFSEAISDLSGLGLSLTAGENPQRGSWITDDKGKVVAEMIDYNKAKFTYNISGADGGEVKVILNGEVKDIAGNNSQQLNIAIDTKIVLEQKVISVDGNKYSFTINEEPILDFSKPTYCKPEDKIIVTKISNDGSSIIYNEYTVPYNERNLEQITYMLINEENYISCYPYEIDGGINISEANIYFDAVLPGAITKVYVKEALESGIYSKGTEITIDVTTTEEVDANETQIPEILVSFSESGIGKYNYNEQNGSGYAIKTSERINDDRTTTWTYKYVVQEFDEGHLNIAYKTGKLVDLAGNKTDVLKINNSNGYEPSVSVTGSNWGNGTEKMPLNIAYEIYKNEIKPESKVTSTTYFTNDDDIYIKVKFDKVLYVCAGETNGYSHNVRLDNKNKDRAPSLYMGGDEKIKCTVDNIETTSDSTHITYKLENVAKKGEVNQLTKLTKLLLKNENNNDSIDVNGSLIVTEAVIPYSGEYYDTYKGDGSQTYDTNTIGKNALKTIELNESIILDPLSITEKISNIKIENICADTTAPTVTIKSNTTNPTNADDIMYTFTWSEDVVGFNEEDVIVTNGNKVWFVKIDSNASANGDANGDGKVNMGDVAYIFAKVKKQLGETANNSDVNGDGKVDQADVDLLYDDVIRLLDLDDLKAKNAYVMVVKNTIPSGNRGEVKVAVEQNACQDKVGLSNVRTESIIEVDKIAPVFISLEAFAESNINLNSNVDIVKEYYKEGDVIKVVATFSENIGNYTMPELALQFSESGNAKGSTLSEKNGNKIIYTYTIAEKDSGMLSVRGFSGTVADTAGNETVVTKRNLDGNTIIVDTELPSLQELNITTEEGTYKAGNEIVIEAIYDEDVYGLNDGEVKNISSELAPTLKFKFGNGEEREATFKGYAGEEKIKLQYTVSILDGDNGKLSITSYENKANIEVCDIAGNKASLNKNQSGNEIIADTIRPEVESVLAVVESPIVLNTSGYYKEGNRIKVTLTFSEKVSSAVLLPEILIGFSEEAGIEPTEYNTYAYESDWNVNSTTIEYSYTIRKGENGYLWVKVPEGQFRDSAWNTNVEKESIEILDIFADTTKPTITLLENTEVNQVNQEITIEAKCSENVYDLDGNKRVPLTNKNAPKLIYSFGNGQNREIGATSISGDTIEYTIKKDPVNDNGTLYYELAKGNLCDRAGNLYYEETTDTTAPVLESVYITSNEEVYNPYCNEGKEIYVIATFNEPIGAKNLKLKAKVGEVELDELLDGEIIEGNNTKIKFTYTVKQGDMGEFTVLDICGETDDKITEENADKTYGWVRDEHGNQNNIYSFADEGITPAGNAEADTENPYITTIKVEADGEIVATYTKEEGKDPSVNVGRTNANIVEYIVTYSEGIQNVNKSNISITNGTIKNIEHTNVLSNEYKITVQTTVEGVQSLIINEATVEDKVGNKDGFVRFDGVTVDFTKPTVRFISEYNGGEYVLPTNIGKIEIRPNIEVNEEIDSISYSWDNEAEDAYKVINSYSSSSDIAVPVKTFTQEGTHTLYIKVVDAAGNVTKTSKTYEILNSSINISVNTTESTNEDITATVIFGKGLTDNRKVAFKAEGSNELVELNAKGTNENGTQYTITTNGTVYAEATDKVGNKVFNELIINNIESVMDTTAPVISDVKVSGKNITIIANDGEGSGIAEYAITTTTEVPVEWSTSNVIKVTEDGTFYVWAKDNAGNIAMSENVVVVDTTSATEGTPEIIFEGLPTTQVDGVKYVKVSTEMTTEDVTNKMNKSALGGATPEYTKLTEDNKLRTGSEITLNGETKYIIVINGDVNCDGQVTFDDIIKTNGIRISARENEIATEQLLAADINNTGKIEFRDIISINSIRINSIK